MSRLADLGILDVLPLRPLDLGRLGLVCRGLRDLLSAAGAGGIWRGAAARTGPTSAVDSWASAKAHATKSFEFDETSAFASVVHAGSHDHATLQLGSALPYRVAAVSGAVPISSVRRAPCTVVKWSVTISELPALRGVVMWIGVLFDSRGADTESGAPRRLERCGCTGVLPHEPGCALAGKTIRDALRPFAIGPRERTGIMQRFTDSNWRIAALGSTGWVWGASLGGSFVRGMPTFGQGDVVRVALDLAPGARGRLSFAVNGGPWVTAVQQLFLPRSTPAPVLFYPIVHLTDVTLPRDDDLPIEARVEATSG